MTKTLSITSASLFTQEVSLLMRRLVSLLEPAAAEPSARAGRLDLLGCNVAFGEEGARLIDELESLYKVKPARYSSRLVEETGCLLKFECSRTKGTTH